MRLAGDPSQLVLLDEVKNIDSGVKIRFLGCADAYVGQDAALILIDHFPATERSSSRVAVHVEHLLESLNTELFQPGTWLNIIGYVKGTGNQHGRVESIKTVEASMIWSAGPVKLAQYKEAAEAYKSSRLEPL